MRKKIEDIDDVRLLVRSFYRKVLKDELLSPFFAHVVKNHWDEHLEVFDRFWSNILFYSGNYFGNPLELHKKMHHLSRLEARHFERWLRLFNETVDGLFKGEKAALAKDRAQAIATVMQLKILSPEEISPDVNG